MIGDFTHWRESLVREPLNNVFDFFSRAENLERITPPWLRFKILGPPPIEMREGTRIAYQLRVRGFPLKWLTEIEAWNPPYSFVDVQAKGPYKFWRHTHLFSECDEGTMVVDVIEYSLPFGWLGRMAHRLFVKRDVAKIFDYREEILQTLFSAGSLSARNSKPSSLPRK